MKTLVLILIGLAALPYALVTVLIGLGLVLGIGVGVIAGISRLFRKRP